MRTKRGKLVIAILLCIALAIVWAIFSYNHEPYYRGRSLSEWYTRYQSSVDREDAASQVQAEEARLAIRAIGTNAIPFLLKSLRYEASPIRQKLAQFVGKTRLLGNSPVLSFVLPSSKCDPASVFRALGELGAPAIPELTRLLLTTTNQVNVHRTSYCLAAIGKESVSSLIIAVSRPEAVYREQIVCWFAAENVFDFGTNIAQATPELVKCSTDSNPTVSAFAVKALGRVDAYPEIILPALTNALSDPHAAVRYEAAFALGRNGPRAIIAIGNLSALLTDEYERVRIAATNALLNIAPGLITNSPPQ